MGEKSREKAYRRNAARATAGGKGLLDADRGAGAASLMRRAPIALACLLAAGCSASRLSRPLPEGAEALSLLGDTLRAPQLTAETHAAYGARLADAARNVEARPDDVDALIWLGRRTAYLGRYRDAIAIYTRALDRHADDARLYRHRGHRWITVREFARATRDLERAAALTRGRPDEVEPDGLPNTRGIPTSTLQSNIWYHLALAHYLRAEWSRALAAWQADIAAATNDDMRIAAGYWHYLTLRRLGRDAEARAVLEPVRADLDIIENHAYHRLLLAFKGERSLDSLLPSGAAGLGALDDATTGYGVGAFLLASGDTVRALGVFRRVRAGGNWASFGYIAAEAELARHRAP